MKHAGVTPLEVVAFLALGSLAVLVALPVGYRHLIKAHRQAATIRHWDVSLSAAQENAVRQHWESQSKTRASSHK